MEGGREGGRAGEDYKNYEISITYIYVVTKLYKIHWGNVNAFLYHWSMTFK